MNPLWDQFPVRHVVASQFINNDLPGLASMFIQKSFKELPFPGIYVLDEDGQVIEKFFNRSLAIRSSAGNILNSALGEILLPEDDPAVDFINDQIEFTAFLADPELQLEVRSTLYVRFEVTEGLHIYADPLPRGFIATTVSVADSAGLIVGEASQSIRPRR